MGQIRQNAKAKTEFGPPSSDRALYSDKARSFNQSERALYLDFIIIKVKKYFKTKYDLNYNDQKSSYQIDKLWLKLNLSNILGSFIPEVVSSQDA